jgi:hypothetical protein
MSGAMHKFNTSNTALTLDRKQVYAIWQGMGTR